LFTRYLSLMVETIGEAMDLSWRLTARCAWGKHEGLKTIRECNWRIEIDMPTLVATRGRDFPISLLSTRMRCLRCGSRRIAVAISPPFHVGRARSCR
jgi:hypothetical protein